MKQKKIYEVYILSGDKNNGYVVDRCFFTANEKKAIEYKDKMNKLAIKLKEHCTNKYGNVNFTNYKEFRIIYDAGQERSYLRVMNYMFCNVIEHKLI